MTTAGNVGIGTTTPSAKLQITGIGTGTGVAFRTSNSSNNPVFSIQDNGLVTLRDGTNNAFNFDSAKKPHLGSNNVVGYLRSRSRPVEHCCHKSNP